MRPAQPGAAGHTPVSESARVRERANAEIKRIAERRGVGRFLKLAETPGVYASHPLGGARMADEIGLGVVDDVGEVFGYEGLYCMDSSIMPTSFGVNPSLSISAVCERAAARLVARGRLRAPGAAALTCATAPPACTSGRGASRVGTSGRRCYRCAVLHGRPPSKY